LEEFKWSCKSCGICCEIFSQYTLGHQCPKLREDRTCAIYNTRPKDCRIETIRQLHQEGKFLPGDNLEVYLMIRCSLVKHLKNWIDENKQNKEICDGILSFISKSGLL
jgi:Fe-S-cluster containining protein